MCTTELERYSGFRRSELKTLLSSILPSRIEYAMAKLSDLVARDDINIFFSSYHLFVEDEDEGIRFVWNIYCHKDRSDFYSSSDTFWTDHMKFGGALAERFNMHMARVE